jgi:hypothetical protein
VANADTGPKTILETGLWSSAMIIERLSQEHLNIEKLLAILERELEVSIGL